jgi:hypothetical protein
MACGGSAPLRNDAAAGSDAATTKDITSFVFLAADNPGLATEVTARIADATISADVPFGTNVASLVARFDTSGVQVAAAGVLQTSGVTAVDFTAPVEYDVTAADGSTRSYQVAVDIGPSSEKAITQFAFTSAANPGLAQDVTGMISGTSIAVTVPYGTNVVALVASFTTTGAIVSVTDDVQSSGQTANDFARPVTYLVIAADGTSTTYTVSVTVASSIDNDIVSFQFLAALNPQLSHDITATIVDRSITATVPFGTNRALVASFQTSGTTVTVAGVVQVSGHTSNSFVSDVTYRVTAVDSSTKDFTVTVSEAPSPLKDITSFAFEAAHNPGLTTDEPAVINGTSIAAPVPAGTNLTGLVASFATTGASVSVNGVQQTSGVTANDFTNPVTYLVTAADGTTKTFTITVTPGSLTLGFSPAANLAAGSLPQAVAVADVNADGRPDVLTLDNVGSVSVMVGRTAPGQLVASFAAKTDFAAVTQGGKLAVSDLNGDGKPDVIVTDLANAKVVVLLGKTLGGSSTPSFTAPAAFGVGGRPLGIAVGDINGDGTPDLAIANLDTGTVSVLLGTTAPGTMTPSFAAAFDFATGTNPHDVALADVNGDGILDLVVTNNGSSTLSVLIGTTAPGATTPAFATHADVTVQSPIGLAVRDVDGDGRPDFAVTSGSGGLVSVVPNKTLAGASAPSFGTRADFAIDAAATAVVIADLDGDGLPDLATSNINSDTTSVLLNTTQLGVSAPRFAARKDFTTGSQADALAVGDFNTDGIPDLAVTNQSAASVTILVNATSFGRSLSFQPQVVLAVANAPDSIAIADLDGDGRRDVAVGNLNATSVSVLMNETTPGSATASFAPRVDISVRFNPADVALADFNGDGRPDLAVCYDSNIFGVELNTTLPGSGSPTFGSEREFFNVLAGGHQMRSMAVADINGDGKPDLVFGDHGSGTTAFIVALNTTAPGATFATFADMVEVPTSGGTAHLTACDLDDDGRPDVAATDATSTAVMLDTTPPGGSSPSFTSFVDFSGTGTETPLVATDFNGDGFADLAFFGSVLLNHTVAGSQSPSFSGSSTLPTGNLPRGLVAGDLDGNGKPDLVTVHILDNTVSVIRNTTSAGATTATFAASMDSPVGPNPAAVAIGDLNGDGRLDIVSGNTGDNTVSVLYSK